MKTTLLKNAPRLVLPAFLLALAGVFAISPQIKEIAAGVAIFLFGMLSLEQGFKTFNGGLFERLLQTATRGMPRSIGFGLVTTTLMQSSSLVSVLTISFLSAGLISLAAGIGVIFGANLGTTTGAWLIAGLGLKVNISAYAMPLLVFGVILLLQKSRILKGLGYVLAGVGFLFLGIHYMKEGFETFKSALDLSHYAVGGFRGLLIYTAVGMLATVVMQSSHATLVLTITALAAQQLSYENALGLAIGSNLGTTISAIIGAIGANVEGRRLAAAHVIFNGLTGAVAILLIGPMVQLVEMISHLLGIANDDYSLKLAVFHSLFNLLGLVLMLPWTSQLVRLLSHLFKPASISFERPKYLSDAAMALPETALEALRQESIRLYDRAVGIIAHGIGVHRHQLRSAQSAPQLLRRSRREFSENVEERYEHGIKSLHAAIVEYSCQVPESGNSEFMERVHALRHACRDVVEAVKALKHLQKNLLVHMRSTNYQVRVQYEALRVQIVKVLRAIEDMRAQPEEAATGLVLDSARVQLKQADLLSDGALDRLIREHQIDARIATSLMKDADYALILCNRLLDAAGLLFGPQAAAAKQVEQSVLLSEDELEQLARRKTWPMRGHP